MREIKFRAYFPQEKLMGLVIQLTGSNDGYKFHKVTAECFTNDVQQFYTGYNFILLQFTGLKDKNGKDIYEGDILKRDDDTVLCVFDNGCFSFECRIGEHTGLSMTMRDHKPEEFEVIGNEFEHPHLRPEQLL